MNWYLTVLKKYAVFNGRARRKEYWMFVLFNLIFAIAAGILDRAIGIVFIGLLYGLAVLLPGLAVAVRRMHDVGRSGWELLIVLIPIAGPIIVLINLCRDSNPGENKYGANPKESIPLTMNSVPQ
jgi:uncharacterized membrane protein YhaH (DUF805 family)